VKIAWFTPFSTKSAIGRVGNLVARELSSQAEVHIWHNDKEDLRQTTLQTIYFPSAAKIDSETLSAYDAIVYNFGNHLPFHKEIFDISRRVPGICIVHDFVMHHFFVQYYLEELKNPASYSDIMGRLYGEKGRRVAADSLKTSPRIWETDDVVEYPLFEEVVRGAYGVVTHSDFFREKVRAVFPGPLTKLYLPYDVIIPERAPTRADIDVPEDKILVVTVGHVNPNKRIHAVIDALAQCGSADKIVYAVLGPHQQRYRHRLASSARKLGLESVVRFPGAVSDDVLEAYLANADICVNLRFPAIEGASASIVEEMLHGKPVIVTDTGFYSELPNDCVSKIRPTHEGEDLAACLRKLVGDREARLKTGRMAKQFAEAHFQPAEYAKELLRFIREVRSTKPLLQLADRIAGEFRTMGIDGGMDIVDTVSQECFNLFCREDQ
jgi:glycosyltransferase involved in cell wall biosynthesis